MREGRGACEELLQIVTCMIQCSFDLAKWAQNSDWADSKSLGMVLICMLEPFASKFLEVHVCSTCCYIYVLLYLVCVAIFSTDGDLSLFDT